MATFSQDAGESVKGLIVYGLSVGGIFLGLFIALKIDTSFSRLFGGVRGAGQKGLGHLKGAYGAHKESNYGKFRAGRAAERARAIATGNLKPKSFLDRARVDRLARSRLNRALNKSSAFNTLTGGYGGARSLGAARQQREAQEDVQKYFANDYEIAEAWIESRGTATGSKFNLLTDGQKKTYNQMLQDKQDKSADSFIAAQRLVANSARGDQNMLNITFEKINELSPETASTDIKSLSEEVRGTWRSKGRGDLVADTHGKPGQPSDREHAFGANWSEVNPHNISRHAFDARVNPEGSMSFKSHISNRDNLRDVIKALDDPWQDERAKSSVIAAIKQQYAGEEVVPGDPNSAIPPVISPVDGQAYSTNDVVNKLREEFKLNPGSTVVVGPWPGSGGPGDSPPGASTGGSAAA